MTWGWGEGGSSLHLRTGQGAISAAIPSRAGKTVFTALRWPAVATTSQLSSPGASPPLEGFTWELSESSHAARAVKPSRQSCDCHWE